MMGCDLPTKENHYVLKGSGEYIHLNTSGSISPKSKFIKYFENPFNTWLCYGNTGKNELIIYRLPSGDIEKKIRYDRQGPNSIGTFRGALIHNFDSIFVVSATFYNELFLTDTSGRVSKKYIFEPIGNMRFRPALLPMYSHISQENVFHENCINLSTYVFTDVSTENLHEEIINFEYDFTKNRITSYSYFPSFTGKFNESLDGYSRAFNGVSFIYSFGRLDDIYVLDSKGNYSKYPCKSQYRKKSLDWANNPADPMPKQQELSISNPIYKSILFDKYRKLIYRFFFPGYEVKKGDSIKKHYDYPNLFSIMILDEDFNLVGENLFPEKTYDPYMSFISNDGLYLALHIDHPLYNPDLLTFERMALINCENVLRK